jgi:hypothetical protein
MSGHFNYETNTWYDLRDVCGPQRAVVSIAEQSNGTFITFSCGHIGQFNQIFDYSRTASLSCHACIYASDNVIRKEVRHF